MKDDHGYVLRFLHQLIHLGQEVVRRRIMSSLDIPPIEIIVPDVDDEVILQRNFITFHDNSQFLPFVSMDFFVREDKNRTV